MTLRDLTYTEPSMEPARSPFVPAPERIGKPPPKRSNARVQQRRGRGEALPNNEKVHQEAKKIAKVSRIPPSPPSPRGLL